MQSGSQPNLSNAPDGVQPRISAGIRRASRASDLQGGVRWAAVVAAAALLTLVMLPLLAITLRAAPTAAEAMGHAEATSALGLTLVTSLTAVGTIIILGTPTAWLIARRRIKGWRVIDAILDLPTVLPPSVAGIGLLLAFGRRGLLGPVLNAADIELAFTTAAVVMAQMFVAAPLYIRAAVIGLRQIDPDLEHVAMVEGATTLQVFRYVTLPLSAPALLSGSVLAWARALGEFGATILFAGNIVGITQTMSLAIYINFQSDTQAALALAFVLVAVSFVVLIAVRLLRQSDV
ncbi:MAG: ABC transporter permease [Chloroflexi bacterium]|nr:ABC transporter permease [Chloroflexota bacterium]